MYAYRQQIQTRPLHIVPQHYVERPKVAPKTVRKNIKRKKKNHILEFFRFITTISLLSLFGIFVLPTTYNSLIKQVFSPTDLSTKTFIFISLVLIRRRLILFSYKILKTRAATPLLVFTPEPTT